MYILFEEHQYESSQVEKVLKDIYVLQDVDKKVSVQYVGYFYNPHLKDCVFILPKVLLDKDDVLVGVLKENNEKVTPEDVITPEGQKVLSNEYRKFIYEFSVWIYRAINLYYNNNKTSKAILYKSLPQSGKGKRHQANTYLDIVLSLINFNKEHRDFVLFTIKNLHRGNNKINWTRTIAHSQAYIDGNSVVYLNPVNKKRVVNYNEELFVIFFSILNYLNEEYGFNTPINIQYELIDGALFKQYLNGLGKRRLQQIKYKYFADKALLLWDLCYAFFDNTHCIAVNTHAQEYLLAKSFHVVFEAMVDELIGDKNVPKGLKVQDDGKRVDHLYTDLALTSPDEQDKREVYYIGDSKYYKSGHEVQGTSVYKQHTYARNVVQWNVNLFLEDKSFYEKEEDWKYDNDHFRNVNLRDKDLTEGYDVIPNFFISAFVYDDHKYNDGKTNIRKHCNTRKEKSKFCENCQNVNHCTKVSYQFKDRLFDRDTLFLSHYDVNFLYILYLYARNKSSEKAAWREHVRKMFREEIRGVIAEQFKIYAMRARQGVDGELYLKQHFYELNGRVFQPYGENREVYFAYAQTTSFKDEDEKKIEEQRCNELKKYFVIEECKMGDDPEVVLKEKVEKDMSAPAVASRWLPIHYLEREPSRGVLLGYYKDEAHLKWILGNNDKGTLIYNVRLTKAKAEDKRDGAQTESFYKDKNVKFVILYTDGVEKTGEYRVFHVKDLARKVTEERMKETLYPFNPSGDYLFFRFDEEVNIGKIKIVELLKELKNGEEKYKDGEPIFTTAEEVKKYREGFDL